MNLIEPCRDRLEAAQIRPPEPVISVEGLCTHYGRRQILFDVDFADNPGAIMVIMGGSGSGKSTLMRHMIGIDRATSGTIRLLGQDITKLRCATCRRSGARSASRFRAAHCSAR